MYDQDELEFMSDVPVRCLNDFENQLEKEDAEDENFRNRLYLAELSESVAQNGALQLAY